MSASILTDRLILRPWQDSDRMPFARMNADPCVMEFFPALLSRQQSDSLVNTIEAHFDTHGFGPLAAELRQDSTFIGCVGLNIPTFEAPFTPCVEIAWRLSAEYWGQGLATEAARAALRYGFQNLGLDQIVAFTVPVNARSRRVMDKLGMFHDSAHDFDHPQLPQGHCGGTCSIGCGVRIGTAPCRRVSRAAITSRSIYVPAASSFL